ncbi:uncharacterized protein LOC127149587 [Cucumis melo]|uniref:Uncharacterized protein LOC127149587 n=2 Tax=Cucumis melo TaxID=3656 RepID=A0ABM3KU58_CUCME|nr:uncharacterized protein LOC127149587 [Cucumis melo]
MTRYAYFSIDMLALYRRLTIGIMDGHERIVIIDSVYAMLYALQKILKWSVRSSKHEVQSYDRSEGIFHVKTGRHELNSKGGNIQILRLSASERYCSFSKWQAFGIPCSHFMAVCSRFNMNYEDFVEDYYKISTYAACYAPQFQPVPHEDYWITPTSMPVLLPDPSLLRKSGRPKTSRYHNEMDWTEQSAQQRCSFCSQLGHNRRSCTLLRRQAPDS